MLWGEEMVVDLVTELQRQLAEKDGGSGRVLLALGSGTRGGRHDCRL
jgi:hypothetical protein